MSKITKIQWCHSTVNPIMGCLGCELFPKPIEILEKIDKELSGLDSSWRRGRAGEVFRKLIAEIPHDDGEFSRALTTTNIYHLRERFADMVNELHGRTLALNALKVIEEALKCYAGLFTLHRGYSIVNPSRKVNVGYVPYFEKVTRFPGRVAMMARLKKPLKPDAPWLDGQPHLVFVSDMGDAFCCSMDLEYFREDAIPAGELDLTGIDWVIVGGESGAAENAKLSHLEWVDELMERCRNHDVAFFVKQLGRRPHLRGVELKLKDTHGVDWTEWPAGYAVREFPETFRKLTAQDYCSGIAKTA